MDVVNEVVNEHPLATLGAALIVGFALGGGLASPGTRRLLWTGLKLGVRLAVVPALQQQVSDLASSMGENLRAASGEPVFQEASNS